MPDVDSILVQNGLAHEIWRGMEKAKLPPFHPDVVAMIFEASAGSVNEGYIFDSGSQTFSAPPEP